MLKRNAQEKRQNHLSNKFLKGELINSPFYLILFLLAILSIFLFKNGYFNLDIS